MGFNDIMKIKVDFGDMHYMQPNDSSFYAYTEVLLIDHRGSQVPPFVYQLTQKLQMLKEDLGAIRNGMISLESDCFLLMGELAVLDREKKQAVLIDNKVISYKYLVIALDTKYSVHSDREFLAGLEALVDALRLREMVKKQLGKTKKMFPDETKGIESQLKPLHKEDKNPLTKLPPFSSGDHGPSMDHVLSQITKRLFEVHV